METYTLRCLDCDRIFELELEDDPDTIVIEGDADLWCGVCRGIEDAEGADNQTQ